MSFQSDLLDSEEQHYLFENVDLNIFEAIENEETLMVSEIAEFKHQPTNTRDIHTTILSNEEYNGPFTFEVDVIPNGSKNAWVYSSGLNKIYMDMKSPFPVDFKVLARPEFPLYIRITPMYSSPQFAQECVYRCLNHQYGSSDNFNQNRFHVMRCHNPHTEYIGDKERNDRLNLRIPFSSPQTGTENVREMFEFMCKNSCPMPGMNRRPIEVIFTLENEIGDVFGRKALHVKICSCPKRDKEKDEKANAGKPPPGKKRKVEKPVKKVSVSNDLKEVFLTIPVVGKHNTDQILKYCQDLFSGEVLRHANGAEGVIYKQVLSKINTIIKERTE